MKSVSSTAFLRLEDAMAQSHGAEVSIYSSGDRICWSGAFELTSYSWTKGALFRRYKVRLFVSIIPKVIY